MGRSDVLVGLGAVMIGVALWFMGGWAAVMLWCGLLVIAIGVAEARRG